MNIDKFKRFNTAMPYPVKLLLKFIVLFFALFFIYIWFKPLYEIKNESGQVIFRAGSFAQLVSTIIIVFVVAYGGFLHKKKELTFDKLITLVFAIGMAIRLCYMLNTAPNSRQYDTYSSALDGHEAYAWGLFENFKMPETNNYQFYHPPINAFLQAMFMHVTDGLTRLYSSIFGTSEYFLNSFTVGQPESITSNYRYYLYGTCQILSYIYSIIIMILGLKILKIVGLKGKKLVFWFTFFALFPRHIIFSATLNNDQLAYLFDLAAIYFTLKWWIGDRKLKDILLCGLMVGLGISTKLSAATVCLPIGLVFIYEFIKCCKKTFSALSFKQIFIQYGLFLLVCAPIAFSFIIYAKIRFNQPIGYVFPGLNSALSTANISFFERFVISFDKNEYFYTIYLRTFYNKTLDINNTHNLWNFLARSSLFGEFGYWQGESFAFLSVVLMSILPIVSIAMLVAMIVSIAKKKAIGGKNGLFALSVNQKSLYFGIVLMLTQVISIIYFYIKMPYSCTMDFRYIMPSIIAFALIYSNFEECVTDNKKSRILNSAFKCIIAMIIIFMSCFFMTAI